MPLIQAKKIEKIYTVGEVKTRALRGVSFDINNGEFVVIMGASGSGKSTLLHVLGFLDRHSKGKYIFDKKNFDNYTDDEAAKLRNQKMGFVFQAFNLLPRTSVFENVKLPLLYSNLKKQDWDDLTLKAINIVGLSHRADHLSNQLSGGEKQRVAIARALVNNPPVVFADEPTGNLDSKNGHQIMQILQKLNQKGKTVIVITHEKDMAKYAKRLIVLKDGMVEKDKSNK